MRRPPITEDFASPVHDTRDVARLGIWLGAAFLICFLTGLNSHLHQHPIAWFRFPQPVLGLPRHPRTARGDGGCLRPAAPGKDVCRPPRLFERPMAGSMLRILERGSIAVLVASSLLQVFTGVANIAQWYVFGFGFTAVHFSLARMTIGALAVHIAVKLPAIREAFVSPVDEAFPFPVGERTPADEVALGAAFERRWFIRGAGGWPRVLSC